MSAFEQALSSIDGGRVLDVATGHGGFVGILKNLLGSFLSIVGTDSDYEMLKVAQQQLANRSVPLIQSDGEHLALAEAFFDTITISASLHHLVSPHIVLAEMWRVLKPGGHFIVAELTCDGQTAAQQTTVYLHQWLAAVDESQNIAHFGTLPRQKILGLVGKQDLTIISTHDKIDTLSDPMDTALIARFDELIHKTQERIRADKLPERQKSKLIDRGRELKKRLRQVGSQPEPAVIIVARK